VTRSPIPGIFPRDQPTPRRIHEISSRPLPSLRHIHELSPPQPAVPANNPPTPRPASLTEHDPRFISAPPARRFRIPPIRPGATRTRPSGRTNIRTSPTLRIRLSPRHLSARTSPSRWPAHCSCRPPNATAWLPPL
jgi:hypothetical protein